MDLTSVIFADRSSLWETGVGNLPAEIHISYARSSRAQYSHTFGETRTQKTGDLFYKCVGSDECIVLAGKLLDQFLVLVELLQVIRRHGINAAMLGTIDIVLITKNAGEFLLALDLHCIPTLPTDYIRTYQMVMPGRGTWGRRTVPEKRLSR